MQLAPLLLIPLMFLTSCSHAGLLKEKDIKITTLEQQIQELKRENANIREDLVLARAGGIPDAIAPTGAPPPEESILNEGMFPAGTVLDESSNAGCIKKAQDNYIAEGNKRCTSSGYTDSDIQSGKCQLKQEVITELNTLKTNALTLCGP